MHSIGRISQGKPASPTGIRLNRSVPSAAVSAASAHRIASAHIRSLSCKMMLLDTRSYAR